MGRKLRVEVWHDPDTENPCDADGSWKLYSFSTRHLSFKDPSEFFPLNIGLRRKMSVGLAYKLSYFEHGNSIWMLKGSPKGMLAGDWKWDGVDVAGMLIWEQPARNMGPKSKDDREADAKEFLELYTNWCNGETYGFTVTEVDAEDLDSESVAECGGFIGTDSLLEYMFEDLDDDDEIVSVESEFGITLDDVVSKREEYLAKRG